MTGMTRKGKGSPAAEIETMLKGLEGADLSLKESKMYVYRLCKALTRAIVHRDQDRQGAEAELMARAYRADKEILHILTGIRD